MSDKQQETKTDKDQEVRGAGRPPIHTKPLRKTVVSSTDVWEAVAETSPKASGEPCYSAGANKAFDFWLSAYPHLDRLKEIGGGNARLGLVMALDRYEATAVSSHVVL